VYPAACSINQAFLKHAAIDLGMTLKRVSYGGGNLFSSEGTGERLQQQLTRVYERANQLSFGILDILRYAIRRYNRVRGGEGAASIAFFTIFSLFPLLLVLVAIGSFILESDEIQRQILDIVRLTIPISPELVLNNIEQVLEERSTIGLVGLIGLAWSASGVLTTLVRNIDRAWPIARPRNFFQNRLVALGMIAALIALLGITSLTNTILSFLQGIDVPILADDPFWRTITTVLPFIFAFFIFLGIYRWVPNTFVPWKSAFWAALVAAIAFEITSGAFSWYLQSGLAQYRLVYGSLGTIVALMFWIYLNCLIIIFCAHLSAAIKHHKEPEEGQE
jgi:membrane protein